MKAILPQLTNAMRNVSGALIRGGRAAVRSRRAFLGASALALAGLFLQIAPAGAEPHNADASHWVATWGTAPAGPPLPAEAQTFTDQTMRLIVHTSIGGSKVRIRLSNELGAMPLRIGAAHIALRDSGASIAPGTDRTLTFGNAASVTIAPGAAVLSDPVSLTVPALSDLAVSLHSPGTVRASTIHSSAAQTSFVSPPGNYTGSVKLPAGHTITSWPFLTEVDVSAPGSAAIVALGDSITDASITKMDANHRWPDLLALRLHPMGWLGVVNRGISGNRLLRDPGDQPLFGKAALARLDRDVFASAGVRHMIVLIGINDIGHPGTGNIAVSESVTAEELIAGYRRVIAAARKKGIAIYGATLAPFEGTRFEGYFTPRKEAVRKAVNDWIRGSGEFDAVIDFDQALRDPAHPTRLLPVYDSGDHLHPNDRGTQAMADAIPLGLFSRTALAPAAQRQ